MKKILFLMTTLFSVTAVQANSVQKLNTIKEMYQLDKKVNQGNPTLQLFADRGLQKAFDLIPDGEVCGVYHNVMWQSQDPDYRTKLQFTTEKNGRVLVKIGNKDRVSYSLNCSTGTCKVTDAFDEGKRSIKQSLISDCS